MMGTGRSERSGDERETDLCPTMQQGTVNRSERLVSTKTVWQAKPVSNHGWFLQKQVGIRPTKQLPKLPLVRWTSARHHLRLHTSFGAKRPRSTRKDSLARKNLCPTMQQGTVNRSERLVSAKTGRDKTYKTTATCSLDVREAPFEHAHELRSQMTKIG